MQELCTFLATRAHAETMKTHVLYPYILIHAKSDLIAWWRFPPYLEYILVHSCLKHSARLKYVLIYGYCMLRPFTLQMYPEYMYVLVLLYF
jgi:hypothetical protein